MSSRQASEATRGKAAPRKSAAGQPTLIQPRRHFLPMPSPLRWYLCGGEPPAAPLPTLCRSARSSAAPSLRRPASLASAAPSSSSSSSSSARLGTSGRLRAPAAGAGAGAGGTSAAAGRAAWESSRHCLHPCTWSAPGLGLVHPGVLVMAGTLPSALRLPPAPTCAGAPRLAPVLALGLGALAAGAPAPQHHARHVVDLALRGGAGWGAGEHGSHVTHDPITWRASLALQPLALLPMALLLLRSNPPARARAPPSPPPAQAACAPPPGPCAAAPHAAG